MNPSANPTQTPISQISIKEKYMYTLQDYDKVIATLDNVPLNPNKVAHLEIFMCEMAHKSSLGRTLF